MGIKNAHTAACFLMLLCGVQSASVQSQSLATERAEFDYFSANRGMIRNGVQAVLMCNGLFTSNRTLAQVFEQELAYLNNPVGGVKGGNYKVRNETQSVSVGGGKDGTKITAAFREGVGCVVMAPNQSLEDIERLPRLSLAEPDRPMSETPWPQGDKIIEETLDSQIDVELLQSASDWAFDRPTPEQDTLSLLVVHKGKLIHERYAQGITVQTKTRTWSTAKSIAASLIGMLVETGKLALDQPLDIEWLPKLLADKKDPRDKITLRNLLHMSSGLYPVDSFGMEYATGSGLSYWAGASSSVGARRRGMVRDPGAFWDYENYDTLLAVHAMRNALGDDYHQFGYRELLHKIGMHNTLMSVDRFGDFILSSQVYTNARDLARFGLLYQQAGRWRGEQLISPDWIEFSTTPAPASAVRNHDYGAQWWLVPDNIIGVPKTAYSTAGNRGQFVIVVPSHDLVIVRRGLDYGKQGFSRWDLTREVLKAFPNIQSTE